MAAGSELKPCPFCGGRTHNFSKSKWWFGCKDCGAEHPIYADKDEAIAAWNRRASPPTAEVELRAEVVEMCCAVVEEARFLSAPEMDLITDAIRDKFTALATADREGERG